MRKKFSMNSVLSKYREEIGQTTETYFEPEGYQNTTKEKKTRRKPEITQYDYFLGKLREKDYDKFNSPDLVYYFQWMATKFGVRYSIASMARDAGMMKNLLKDYSPREVCDMIDFVFTSDQNYLEKVEMTPNILVSAWRNTIYRDTQDWLRGEYKPRVIRKKKAREWKKSDSESVKIGEWD